MNVPRKHLLAAALACIMAVGSQPVIAQSVDRVISYQGLLTEVTGEPLADGAYRLVIRLYDSPTVGTLVFSETQDIVVTKGLFTTLIGSVDTAGIAAVNFNKPLWLETAIEGSAPFTPRTRLAVVPNAVIAERALQADRLNPQYDELVKSLNGAQGDVVVKGANGVSVTRIQDTIRISGPIPNGNSGIHSLASNDGSIAITNADGPDAIIRVADGGITASKLASGSVTSVKLADGAVTGAKLADGAVTSAKIAAGVIPTSLSPSGAAGGDLIGTYPSPLIRAGSVTSDKLANGAVIEGKIADGAITAAKIAAGGVTTSRIADGAVTSAKLQPTGVVPGTYGDYNKVVKMSVDSQGRVTTAQELTLTGIQPGGPAGGDLTGIYPFPEINRNVAGTNIIASINDNMNPLLWVDGTKVEPLADIPASDIAASGRVDSANLQIKQGAVGADELADVPGLQWWKLYGSSQYIPRIRVDADGRVVQIDSAINGLTPVGPAGGDLAGTYPNPLISTSAATGERIITAINQTGVASSIAASRIVDPEALSASDVSTTGNLRNMNMQLNSGVVGAAELADIAGLPTTPQGSGTLIPVITVDGDGRVQNLSTTAITGAPPVGAAGGDLAGTYPNPTINATAGDNVVTAVNNGATTLKINAPHIIDPVADGSSDITTSGNLGAMNMQVNVGTIGAPELADLHGAAIGPIGTATTVPVVSIDTDGRVTALTSTTITGVTPGGSAGGDLAGTYPNPTLATSAIAGSRMVDAIHADYLAGDADINTPQNVVVLDPSGNLPTVYQQAFYDADVTTPFVSFLLPPTTTTSTQLWTLPDVSGTVVVAPAAGTSGRMTRFNANSTIIDGSLDDNGAGTLSRAGNIAMNVGSGNTLSTNGSFVAAQGLTVTSGGAGITGTTTVNTTGVSETRIGNVTGGDLHLDAPVIMAANLPAGSAGDNVVTVNGTGTLRSTPAATIIGTTGWLLTGNTLTGASTTRVLGISAQTGSEDNLALQTDGLTRMLFRGTIDTADVSVSLVPTTTATYALGTDAKRWSNLFVDGASLHIGPAGGAAANTELRVGYAGGTASFNVNGGVTPEMSLATSTVSIDATTNINNNDPFNTFINAGSSSGSVFVGNVASGPVLVTTGNVLTTQSAGATSMTASSTALLRGALGTSIYGGGTVNIGGVDPNPTYTATAVSIGNTGSSIAMTGTSYTLNGSTLSGTYTGDVQLTRNDGTNVTDIQLRADSVHIQHHDGTNSSRMRLDGAQALLHADDGGTTGAYADVDASAGVLALRQGDGTNTADLVLQGDVAQVIATNNNLATTGDITIQGNGELSLNGSQNMRVLVGAAPFLPGPQDHIIVITANAAVDVTLPTAPAQGRVYTVRNAAPAIAVVAAGGADTIEGLAQVNVAVGATVRLVYDGAGVWYNVGN